ncbi:MAG: hypothetical protein HOO96_13290 [Polyangiaceae bacterium]|nr:hypothetical protein [Polyangiaceae bacterium]
MRSPAIILFTCVACGGAASAPSGPKAPDAIPAGACGALPPGHDGPVIDSAPDPVRLAETANDPASGGASLLFTRVDYDACKSLQPAAGTKGINAVFVGSVLVVVFLLPEPASPLSWTVTFPDGTPATYELTDRVQGGNVVFADPPKGPPPPGMLYVGALRLNLRQFAEKGRLRPGSTITVRYGESQAQIRYPG